MNDSSGPVEAVDAFDDAPLRRVQARPHQILESHSMRVDPLQPSAPSEVAAAGASEDQESTSQSVIAVVGRLRKIEMKGVRKVATHLIQMFVFCKGTS